MLNKPTGDMVNAGSDAAPQPLGTATAGISNQYARADHVHEFPAITTAQITGLGTALAAKVDTAQLGVTVATLDGSAHLKTSQLPTITTAQISGLDSALNAKVNTAQLGALNGVATLDGSGKLASAQIPALTSSQIAQITPSAIGAMATSERAGLATLTAGTLTTTQVAALTGDVISSAGNPATTVVQLQGRSLSNAAPSNGQTLQWSGTAWVPGTIPSGGSGGGGLAFYLNAGTAGQAPITNLPGTPKELGRTAEVAGTTITSATLSQTGYDLIAGFVSHTLDPDTTAIPAGLFDLNLWASSNANSANQTIVQLRVYKYDGTNAPTLLATSDDVSIYDPSVTAQYVVSAVLPQTTLALTDRIYVELRGKATANNRTVTLSFGDSKPTHLHTTLPSVGGSGLVKVINGVFQSPASLLVDADVDAAAAIAVSKVAGAVTTTQLAAYVPLSQKGAASGVATLDSGSKLTTSQLPTIGTSQVSGFGSANGFATLDAQSRLATNQLPTITTGQITGLGSALDAKVNTSQLGALNGVAQLDGAGKLATSQIPPLTTSQIAQITPSGIGAVATSSLTTSATANGVPQLTGAGTLSTSQLASISGLPSGPQGSSTVVPVVTVDGKGRVTALSTANIAATGGGLNNVETFVYQETYPATMDTGVTPNTLTLTASGPLGQYSFGGYGYAIAANDTAVLSYQADGTQDGPWQLVSDGTQLSGIFTATWSVGSRYIYVTSNNISSIQVGMSCVGPTSFTGSAGLIITDVNIPGNTLTIAGTTSNSSLGVSGLSINATGAVFQRPTWFSGSVKPQAAMVRFGTYQGNIININGYILSGSTVLPLPYDISVGTDLIYAYRASVGAVPATLGYLQTTLDTTQLPSLTGTNYSGVLPLTRGGTGQATQQAALNALAGTQTANRVLRSNGTNTTLSQVALTTDVTGALPIANGGTGQTTAQAGLNALVGTQTANRVLRSDGTNTSLSQLVLGTDVTGTLAVGNGGTGATTLTGLIKGSGTSALSAATAGTDYVVPSGSITGTASNVTGVVAIANGGTGASNSADAKMAMGGIQTVQLRYDTAVAINGSGTVTLTTTSGSASVSYSNPSIQLAVGMSFSNAGTTAAVVKSIDTGTGAPGTSGTLTLSTTASASGGPTSGTIYATNTAWTSTSAPVMDGRTPVTGDIVVLTAQVASALRGPWVITNNTTSFTFARPSWFSGNLASQMMFYVQYGTVYSGSVISVQPQVGVLTGTTTIGIDGISVTTTNSARASNAVLASNTFTGLQNFAANSPTGSAPFKFGGSGSGLNTTPVAHQVEWDGTFMYNVTAGAVRSQQAAFIPAPATATSTGTAGQVAYDSTSIYVCVAANTWRKAALATF